jgi:hypothetical protein
MQNHCDLRSQIHGDVWLEGYHLNDVSKIPEYIKFRDVKGKFVLTNSGWQNIFYKPRYECVLMKHTSTRKRILLESGNMNLL